MSYDITFKVKVEGTDEWVPVGDCDANITWNVGQIIRESTGLEWKNEENNGYVIDILPALSNGVHELVTNPQKYKAMESPNGWGTVEGVIRFFGRIAAAYNDLLEESPEIAKVATFWIE